MATQKESFVFHFDYIEDVPEELQAQYAMYAINYARYGQEPELTDWRDIKMWNKTKQRIDEESEKYEKKCSNLKNHRIEKRNIESTSNRDRVENENTGSTIENEKSSGDTEYEYDTESVTESEIENEYEAPEKVPDRTTPSASNFSNTLFEIFQEAGLPCANGNPITFLQRDFKNAMAHIHRTPELSGLHSRDIITACENYAKTVNDPGSYIKGRYSLDRFVTFKNFADFLPANFNRDNFQGRNNSPAPQEITTMRWMETCPGCKQKALAFSNDTSKYICTKCGKSYEYEEINK